MSLSLTIVSTRGVDCALENIESIVVRRREAREPGSEIAILPHHAPLLMQMQPCTARVAVRGHERRIELGAGVLEVYRDRVTVALTGGAQVSGTSE